MSNVHDLAEHERHGGESAAKGEQVHLQHDEAELRELSVHQHERNAQAGPESENHRWRSQGSPSGDAWQRIRDERLCRAAKEQRPREPGGGDDQERATTQEEQGGRGESEHGLPGSLHRHTPERPGGVGDQRDHQGAKPGQHRGHRVELQGVLIRDRQREH